MIKLYLDFDGVILNTIDVTYKMLNKKNITNQEQIDNFYKNLDWNQLLSQCEEINHSIQNIKRLLKSKYYQVAILTHVISKEEADAKRQYLKNKIKNLEVITVNINKNKCDEVDCKNAILVDDYINNLELWYQKGGIPIKFSDKGKECKFISIQSLDELIEKYDEIEKLLAVSE